MNNLNFISRRSFLGLMAAAPLAAALPSSKQIPVGLETVSVAREFAKDMIGTLRAVAGMGYQCVEFFSWKEGGQFYYDWTLEYAKQVRAALDELNIRCYSTHNPTQAFTPDGIGKAIDLNKVLGARYVVGMASEKVASLDDFKSVAETLNRANETLKKHGLRVAYHNEVIEWKPVDGKLPMELLAATLDKSIMLQLDMGPCLETGNDPAAWINRNPGRIHSMHIKDWSPDRGYKVLLGEGIAHWKDIFAAAEKTGGIEYYLIEEEGSEYSEMDTARKCLQLFRKLHG